MRQVGHIVSIMMIVLTTCLSFRTISSFLTGEEVVAEVGSSKLYRSDLDKVIPRGISQEDSVRLSIQYINTWASDLVYLTIAEQQLSKAEKDVSKELEDYRKSLLKYRYEQLYVNERLDTAVSQELLEDYYLSHQDKFRMKRPLVKARYLCIAHDSPTLEPIRKRMSSDDIDDILEADSLAFSSAIKFTTWDESWQDISVLAREYAIDYATLLTMMNKKGWIEHKDTAGVVRLAYISQINGEDAVAPIEYCAPMIRDMIISARKQALVNSLERDLLKDARENGQFVIY
jgi:hypothetical protein